MEKKSNIPNSNCSLPSHLVLHKFHFCSTYPIIWFSKESGKKGLWKLKFFGFFKARIQRRRL